MKHYTKNRQLIMRLLSEVDENCGLPPYSASDLRYMIESIAKYATVEYRTEYGINQPQSIRQIHRTLKDLEKAGLIVGIKELQEHHRDNILPRWVTRYQPIEMVDHNALIAEIQAICYKVERAKYGVSLFGGTPFDYGALPDDVQIMKAKLKALMQKTHPDKATGYTEEFKQLKNCMSMIRSGIPLPTDKPPKADVKQNQLG